MELTEDEIIQNYGERCGHCNRNTLPPYEYEWSCLLCGFNLIKRKHEFSKIQRKKIKFINRLKYAEEKMFCICIDVYRNCDNNDYDKIFGVLSTLKKKKLKINNTLIENSKNLMENHDFEQDHCSRTAIGIYKIGHDSIRLMK